MHYIRANRSQKRGDMHLSQKCVWHSLRPQTVASGASLMYGMYGNAKQQ